MSSEPRVTWTVDSEKASREDAKEILDQIDQQVKEQTGSGIDVYEVEELSEAEAGQLLIEFMISTSAVVTAKAITTALRDRKETKKVDGKGIQVNVDADEGADVDININTDEETNSSE